MAEIIDSGWLRQRSGQDNDQLGRKFSPYVLSDNVVTTGGTKYDDVIKAYITNLYHQFDGHTDDIYDALYEMINNALKNYFDDEENTLYIIDNNNHIIARIDADGVHSVNFHTPTVDLNTWAVQEAETVRGQHEAELNLIENKLKNIYDTEDDVLYIIDNNNNVIAKIDANGIHSVDFHIEDPAHPSNNISIGAWTAQQVATIEGYHAAENTLIEEHHTTEMTAISNNHQAEINMIETRLSNFFDGNDSALYIIDNSNNIIAKINQAGITSINYILPNGLNTQVNGVYFSNTSTTQIDFS